MLPEKIPIDSLRDRARIKEWQFSSAFPIVGGVICGLRSYVYSLACKWAVRDAIQQQSDFNYGVLDLVETLQSRILKLEGDLNQSRQHIQNLEWQIVYADHTLLETRRHLAELRAAIHRDLPASARQVNTESASDRDELRTIVDQLSETRQVQPESQDNGQVQQNSDGDQRIVTDDD